ncbi:MAG: TetR/AcrR family transcriptional regulator [Leifsonia sp.]
MRREKSQDDRSPATRIPAAERRELILDAATNVFGELGYAGATTDQVAKAAGISQPYVVRMFGSKENLFVEVLERTCDRIVEVFRAAIADSDDPRPVGGRIGAAYVDLVSDRGIMLSLMQGFMLGTDPRIGPVARAGFMRIYRLLREEGGFGPVETRDFLANGMLINTLLASGLTGTLDDDPETLELFECTFQGKLPLVLEGLAANPALIR